MEKEEPRAPDSELRPHLSFDCEMSEELTDFCCPHFGGVAHAVKQD